MDQPPELLAWLENERGERIPLAGFCTFGRVVGNTIVLPRANVSRRHAMIHQQGGEYWVVDLGSTNGLEINGERVTHPVPLRPGDRLQLPSAAFTFRQGDITAPRELPLEPLPAQYELTMANIRMVTCWILVADIQGFTKMSQQLSGAELAPLMGKWMAHCEEILRNQKGVLAKFLGDGVLAYWTAREDTVALVSSAAREFEALRTSTPLPFRLVLHYGEVSFGGHSPDASHTMLGPELNFVFRLEKVAARLKLPWLFSESAAIRLKGHLPLTSCGLQSVPDFETDRHCYTLST
jgi:class 3 adenylate cyclase